MADCFSLPNAAEILKNIRWMYADEYWVQIAADAIEALLAENAKLRKERDAAVEDLEKTGSCLSCVHCNLNDLTCDCLDECALGTESKWEWRGVKGEENGKK